MKPQMIIIIGLIAGVALAGPLNLRNDQVLREHQAKQAYESSTNYYSADQFAADVAAAQNFNQLQAIMVKKAKADQAREKAQKNANISMKNR